MTMKVTLNISGHLRRIAFSESNGSAAEIELPENEILDSLLRRYSLDPDIDKIVLVNGRHAGPRYMLKDGDQIIVLPEIDGG